jgi:hypothetical protein
MVWPLCRRLGILDSRKIPGIATSTRLFSDNKDDKLIKPINFNKSLKQIYHGKQLQPTIDDEKDVWQSIKNTVNYYKKLDHKPEIPKNVDVLIVGGGIIGTLTVIRFSYCPVKMLLKPCLFPRCKGYIFAKYE